MTPQKSISSFLSALFRKDSMVYQSERIDKVKSKICDGALITTAVMCIPGLIASLLRAYEIGIKPVMFVHIFVATMLWGICLAKLVKIYLSYRFRAFVVILVFYIVAVTGMLQFGLLAAASVWLVVVPSLSAILFSTRIGLITMLVTILSFIVIAILDLNGFITLNVNADEFAVRLVVWINYSICYLFAGGVLLVAISISINSLTDSLGKTDYAVKQLKLILESANNPIFSIDTEGKLDEWNKNSEKIIGFTKEDVLGKDLLETYVIEEYRVEVKKVIDDALLGKEITNFEFSIYSKKGKPLMILLNTSTRYSTEGLVTGVLLVGLDITERIFQNKEKEKRVDELALANSELAFQIKKAKKAGALADAVQSTVDTAWLSIDFSPEGTILKANDNFVSVLGYSNSKDLVGKHHKIFCDADYIKSSKYKSFWKNLADGKEQAGEFKRIRKDGSEIWINANYTPVLDVDGRVLKIIKIASDISEMVAVRVQADAVQSAVDTAWLSIEFSPEGSILKANDNFVSVLGYSNSKDLVGKHHKVFCKANYIKSSKYKSFWKNLADGKEQAGEFKRIRKDGSEIWINANYTPVIDAEGRVFKIIKIASDISEMHKLRTVSESIAEELRRFIDTANAPIFGIDSQGFVNEWNETSEKITGFKKEDVLGRDLVQTYITEDYREVVKQVFDDALQGKETANFEFPLFTKEGERVMVLLNSSTRRNAAGIITGVLGVGQDITELVGYRNDLELKVDQRTLKLNEALKKEKELNELKSRFVSIASHEFRTPLSAINFAAGSMKKYWAKMDPLMVSNKLQKIESQVLHMTRLLDDVLIVGQSEAGEMRNHPLNLNLERFISEIIEEVHDSSDKSHDIVLIGLKALKSSNIYIDEKLGRNIFINLLSNAVKFSPNSDKVLVELSSDKNHIIISITDFGIGIPNSELKNIFMPFIRGENVDLIQGTGLGLSIVKEAVDLIGGKIIVSPTLGNGTSFIVKIPKNLNT